MKPEKESPAVRPGHGRKQGGIQPGKKLPDGDSLQRCKSALRKEIA